MEKDAGNAVLNTWSKSASANFSARNSTNKDHLAMVAWSNCQKVMAAR